MPTRPPINTEHAVARVRRGAVVSLVVRVLLLTGISLGFVLSAFGQLMIGGAIMLGVIVLMFGLAARGLKSHQQTARAGLLIDAGQFDEAEAQLAEALETFMLYRSPRTSLLQNLAALRHAQKRYREAALIAGELLRGRQRDPGAGRTLRLMLAECSLQTGDLPTVHAALSGVVPPMPVRQLLKLMELQIEYCVRIGAWQQALDQLPTKIELVELLPAEPAARVQGMLALASARANRPDWCDWLKRRVELLGELPRILEQRPVLREVFTP